MNRRSRQITWLVAGVALTLAVKLLIDQASLPDRVTERPDILMISIDTLRADHLGTYGYERPTSPAIDRFAADALVFDNAFSHSPKTAISHMSLLTGLYPLAHGVRQWSEDSGERLSEDIPTLATLLRGNGYHTGGFGGGGHMRLELGFDQGFDQWQKVGSFRIATSRAVDVIRTMATDPERPFFFFLHNYVVHDPYVPPARYRRQFVDPDYAGEIIGDAGDLERLAGGGWEGQNKLYWDRVDEEDPADLRHLIDLYDAGIRRMDADLSGMLDTLRADGLLDNAIVILVSDHGEEFLEHGMFLHNQVYRELLHVPLIIEFPGERGEALNGRREPAVVQLVDVVPTLLDFIDAEIPPHIQGRSLLPMLEHGEPLETLVLSSWPKGLQRSLRLGDWKLVRKGPELELYNVAEDPDETQNVIASEPEKLDELRSRMSELVSKSRDLRNNVRAGETIVPSEEALEELRALGYIE